MLMLSCESSALRILVVDDHELTRLTLQLVFSCQENFQVVGLASNGQEAIEMVQRYLPDVIILDLQMPIMDGWSASSQIKAISPHSQILAYSSVEDAYSPRSTGVANFDGFCKKDVSTSELIALVRQLGYRRENTEITR